MVQYRRLEEENLLLRLTSTVGVLITGARRFGMLLVPRRILGNIGLVDDQTTSGHFG